MKILYFGSISDALKADEQTISLTKTTTVGEVVAIHLLPRLGDKFFMKMAYAVNGEFASKEDQITDEDVLAVLPPFSGG